MNIAIIMDPIESIHYKKDSSLAMLWAAQDKNWTLSYMQLSNLYLHNGEAMGQARPLKVFKSPEHYYQLGEPMSRPLTDFDVILMRKDPPFDNEYVYATYLLEAAEKKGTVVINRPQSLRDCNEKLFATQFPQCTPEHLVSRDKEILKHFLHTHKDIILKPLDGMGGSAIFRVTENDPNINVIIETITKFGTSQVMAQQYLPAIKDGDKRILMINGEPLDYCLARIPAAGETRGNLAAGGVGRAQLLSEQDRWIAKQVSEELKNRGLIFVGLDVIGEHLTEINVTSPTCIREIEEVSKIDVGGQLMSVIESLVNETRL